MIITTNDGKVLMREVNSGSSRGAGNQLSLHFGLGDAMVNDVVIKWSDGNQEIFTDFMMNQKNLVLHHSLREIFKHGFE